MHIYIATHNKTGLKYFGKTEKYFTQEELQKYYHGSGKYWLSHLKKHGDDVTMEVYGIYNLNEVEEVALKFSEDNNIVKALNESGDRKGKKIWANLQFENGSDGCPKGFKFANTEKMGNNKGIVLSDEHKRKIGESLKGRKMSDSNKEKLIKANKGRIKSKEEINKIIKANTGRKHTEEAKKKISESSKGRKFSDEHKKKIGESSKGRKHSDETKRKMSEKAKNKPKIKCPFCGKEGSAPNMTRWHFENCKFK